MDEKQDATAEPEASELSKVLAERKALLDVEAATHEGFGRKFQERSADVKGWVTTDKSPTFSPGKLLVFDGGQDDVTTAGRMAIRAAKLVAPSSADADQLVKKGRQTPSAPAVPIKLPSTPLPPPLPPSFISKFSVTSDANAEPPASIRLDSKSATVDVNLKPDPCPSPYGVSRERVVPPRGLPIFSVSPGDTTVVLKAAELENTYHVDLSTALRLGMLARAGELDVYNNLVSGIEMFRRPVPVEKIARRGIGKRKVIRIDGNELVVEGNRLLGALDHSILFMQITNVQIAPQSDQWHIYTQRLLTRQQASPSCERCVSLTTPVRTYTFVFDNLKTAETFAAVVNLHRGLGHPLFDLVKTATSPNVFHHKTS